MYSPDRVFLQRLKALDENLGCKYEPGHEHFVITYRRSIGDPVNVLLIEGPDGGFRQPDDRDILRLEKGDLHRVPLKDRLRMVSTYMEEDRERRTRKRREMIREQTLDDRLQLKRAIGKIDHNNGGKSMPFRRINLRQRGETFSTAP